MILITTVYNLPIVQIFEFSYLKSKKVKIGVDDQFFL